MHAEPSHWLHVISLFKTRGSYLKLSVKSGKDDTWIPCLVTYGMRFQKAKSTLGFNGGVKVSLAANLGGALRHSLTSSAQRWFCLSFCTCFSALHSSERNHATLFSMFFSSSKKKCRSFCCPSLPMFRSAGARIELTNLSCEVGRYNHWHIIKH